MRADCRRRHGTYIQERKKEMLKQVSVFAENKKGNLQNITGTLADHGINIWGSVTNDSAEYGIIRMIVDDPGHRACLKRPVIS